LVAILIAAALAASIAPDIAHLADGRQLDIYFNDSLGSISSAVVSKL